MINTMENKRFDATGSHLQDTINYSYDDLVHSFGEPTITQHVDSGKVTVEWQLTFDLDGEYGGKVKATIYDYCTGVPAKENMSWSVGGYKMAAAICVKSTLYLDHEIWKKSA